MAVEQMCMMRIKAVGLLSSDDLVMKLGSAMSHQNPEQQSMEWGHAISEETKLQDKVSTKNHEHCLLGSQRCFAD
ncbi:hypothetical protein J6590_042013 [Homalodisca vitripennis]|nr:hypothetical protein J6590_042013 [Homalodisca vitripennis]